MIEWTSGPTSRGEQISNKRPINLLLVKVYINEYLCLSAWSLVTRIKINEYLSGDLPSIFGALLLHQTYRKIGAIDSMLTINNRKIELRILLVECQSCGTIFIIQVLDFGTIYMEKYVRERWVFTSLESHNLGELGWPFPASL